MGTIIGYTRCEDCDGTCQRRTRCKRCGLLVCRWCYHHIHGMPRSCSEQQSTTAVSISSCARTEPSSSAVMTGPSRSG